jgi:hypothetical protein
MDLNIDNPEQIKQLISILQSLLPKDIEANNTNSSYTNDAIKTKSTKIPKTKNNNKFLQMPEKDMHKSDSKIDKKLCINPPCPRNRKYRPLEVKCRGCGKQEKINPSIAPDSIDRYKCNKCSSSAGG